MKLTKNHGVISILAGIGILVIGVLFSTGSSPRQSIVGNLEQMRIVVKDSYSQCLDPPLPISFTCKVIYQVPAVSIPLKYVLSFSVILILFGTGLIFTRERE
jgi:hypothetical protein